MKKNRKLFLISFFALITLIITTLILINVGNNSKNAPKFRAYTGYYNSDQTTIGTQTLDASNYQKMNTLYTASGLDITASGSRDNTKEYIAIESAMDFYAFSQLAKSNTDFLGYKYVLFNNINWKDIENADFYPIGLGTTPFSGEFDGNGHTISNVKLITVGNDSISETTFKDTHYFALFSKNSGVVKDFGLINPYIEIDYTPGDSETANHIHYVSNVVGLNTGTVSYVFVRDSATESEVKETPGIKTLNMNFEIAGLVAVNNGTFENSYYASSTVYAKSGGKPAQFQEIMLMGTAPTNTFYYNSLINSVSGNTVYYGGFIDKALTYTTHYGTYASSLADLNEQVKNSNNKWITPEYYEDYGSLPTFFSSIITPITRGFDLANLNYDENNDIYEVTINDTDEYSYILELFDLNSKFASNNFKYLFKQGIKINLDNVLSPKYNNGIAATFTTKNADNTTDKSDYATFVLSKFDYKITTVGVDCYGVFPYLTGTVKYLNFVVGNNATVEFNKASDNKTAIGAIAGEVEGGSIDTCYVYMKMSIDSAVGQYYLGSAVGLLTGEGEVKNVASVGTITTTDSSESAKSFSDSVGVVIGGVVGYIDDATGSVDTLLSNVTITSAGYTDQTVTVGGVVGAGYLKAATKLQNRGTITVNGSYANLYTAGVIGRLLGLNQQITYFTNNGNISVTQMDAPTYTAGIMNADIDTGKSNLKLKNTKYFYASCLSNGANIVVTGTKPDTYMYTNVINVMNNNGFITKLSGLYNLNYKFGDSSTALGTQTINMNLVDKFSPVLMSNSTSQNNYIDLTTAYNLRDITFNTTSAVTANSTFNYTGCVLGNFTNYRDVRNEGILKVVLNNYEIAATAKLYISGVFETLSNTFTASSIYNGGDITINEPNGSTAVKNINMYISGICYQNASVDSDEKQNPLSTTFDKTLVGTLNNAINNGNIKVDSYYYGDTAKNTKVNATPNTRPYLNSNIYIGGITNINNGIISNTFNLGDVDIPIYSYSAGKYYEAGGIVYSMEGQYAQIRDSANNGDITIIDTLINSSKSYVNIGGIVARNTKNNMNNKQIISFTINYGTLFAFQSANNMTSPTAANAHATCGGIIGIGVCNLVNVLNYGTVYSNECAAGIVSIVNLKTFSEDNIINFANTINYGVVKINPLYYATDAQALNYQTYNTIISKQYVENGDPSIKKTYSGAICTIFDFNSQTNINIRFLINLCNDATTIMTSLNNPATDIDTSTFITSHGAADYFGNVLIQYAPLSTLNDGNNVGVFNENFIFYKAINGEGLDTEHYVTDLYISDFFEFVKFDKINPLLLDKIGWRTIAYANAAENLFKNISALKTLVNLARTNYSYNNTGITDLLSSAFTNNTWIESMNIELLNSLLDEVFKPGNTDGINTYKTVLKYLLLDSSANSSYTQQIRTIIVNKIMDYYAEDSNINYYELLQSLLYDELLAKIVSGNDANYAEVLKSIKTTLENCNDLSTVLDTYLVELETNSNLLNDLFTNTNTSSYYLDSKIELLQTLLNGYDQTTLKELYEKLNGNSPDSTINYKLYLQNNPNEAKNVYIGLITYNAFTGALGTSYLNWINEYTDKYNLTDVLNEEKNADSNFTKMADNFGNISSLSGYKYPYLNGNRNDTTQDSVTIASQRKIIRQFEGQNVTSLNVTPTKDYSSLWNVIKNNADIQKYISDNYFEEIIDPTSGETYNGIYALATEWNNTYQANERSQLQYNIPISYHGGISVGGSSGNDYYGNKAFTAYNGTSINDMPIKNRYIYVPDEVVSYQTNYYGPFIDANGDNKGVVYSADGNLLAGNANYNKGVAANAAIAVTSGNPKRNMIPVFIGLNSDFVVQKIAESKTSSNNYDTYVFLWNDCKNGTGNVEQNSDYMWKSISFISNKGSDKDPAKNSSGYIYYIYDGNNIASDPDNYIQYGYDFNPNRYTDPDKYITKNNDIKNVTLPNGTTTPGINNTGYKHTYSDYYLRGYVTTSIITGIFMTHSTWPANGSNHISLHSKNETDYAFGNNNGYYGIHTTSYTGYKINDLVNLDGIRTKGHCNSILDEDEINIISALCQKLLSTAEGKEKVLYAIADYAKNNNFNTTDTAVVQMLLSTVQDTDFAKDIIIKGINSITIQNYDNTQTIGAYLNSNGANNITDLKDLIISKSVNDKDNFKTILIEALNNYSLKAKTYGNYYSYTRNDAAQYIYNYLKYKYDNNEFDSSNFDSILQSVSDNDLTYLVNIFDVSSTTFVDNLNNYYNLLSDVGKYIIKDYFVEQRSQNIINTNSTNSYIDFYAKGNGQIKIFNYNSSYNNLSDYLNNTPYQTININSTGYQFYEVTGNGNYVYLFTTLYTTDGSLYTYDSINNEYVPVTSGTYNSSTHYYIKGKSGYIEVLVEDKKLYTIDGSLYTYDAINDEYNPVTSGAYDSTITYYSYDGESYSAVSVTDQNVLVDSSYVTAVGGTIYVNSLIGTNSVYYIINSTNTLLFEFDYSTISSLNLNNSNLAQYNTDFNVNYNKYRLFLEIYPYYRNVTGKTNLELYNNDVFETVITLMATIKQDSTNTNYFTLFADSCFTKEKYIELIKLIALADYNGTNSALDKLISTTYFNDYCDDLLNYLCDEATGILEIKLNAAKYIWSQANSNHSSALADYIYGAYLGNDYLTKSNLKTESLMYTLLNNFNVNGKGKTYYQFIISNTVVNSEKVAELIALLTSSSDFELGGYGIYALSSSNGKLNGEFIPDNLNLDDMDPEYTLTGSIYTLTDDTDASVTDAKWRGATDEDEDYHADYTGNNVTVNEAFYDEMKQLIKSISTVIFDLTLEKNNELYYGDIDLDNHTITYYVPSLTTGTYTGTYTVNNIDLAYRAKAYPGKITSPGSQEFKKNDSITVNALDTVVQTITVFAEDTTVYKTYSIIFKQLSTNLTMVYDTEKTANATETSLTVGSSSANTTVTLNITSTDVKLPKGFDLKPYLSLVLMDGTTETNTKYKMNSDYVTISTLSTDHKIKADGSAVATLIISYKLPAGTYKIKLAICNAVASVEYIKNASSDTSLQLRFENSNVFSGTNKTATTNIPFGRAYNNIELTDFEGIYSDYYEFYLDSYTLAANATMTATVTKSQANKTYSFDGETSVSYKITTYKIVYTVTAEDGTTDTYTHNLKEKDPYAANDKFADVYADGTTVTSINTSFVTNNSQAKVTFERGYEQYYRIKYLTDNIYTLSNNITYEALETTDTDHKGIATLNIEYRGLSADVNTDCDAGIYSFIYKYKNVQEWGLTATLNNDGTYTFTKDADTYIEFTFPRLVIEKTYSTDATIHSIFLIDSHKTASAASTAMSTFVMKPDADHLQDTEKYYESLLVGAPIRVGDEKITYDSSGVDYSAVTYKDYYIVGKVSNAQLSNYAPSFTTEDHAMMFQSTSLYKLQNYGKSTQGSLLDKTVLSNHDTTYLYVPFTYEKVVDGANTIQTKIFLIELDGQTLKKVYDDQFGGTGTELTTLDLTLDDIRVLKNTTNATWPTITTGGTTYTLASCVGDKNNNPSLYMDYIGNPLDNHFWYVSYVVFSEDYIRTDNLSDPKYVKFYHIALIDVSNNVYFNIKVITPNDQIFADIQELYITVFGYQYDNELDETPETKTVSAYVRQATEDENTITYELVYSLQILPSAYYYFMINLPGGYEATTTIETAKVNHTDYLGHGSSHEDAYLPPSSIIVQRVSLTMNVIESTGDEASFWAISTSSTYKITSVILNSKIGGDE